MDGSKCKEVHCKKRMVVATLFEDTTTFDAAIAILDKVGRKKTRLQKLLQ